MSRTPEAAVCILAQREEPDQFRRCLAAVRNHTPGERIELRVAFNRAPESLHAMLGRLVLDGQRPRCYRLPGAVERFDFHGTGGMRVYAWLTERWHGREELGRLLYHDVSLDAEYVVSMDQTCAVGAGCWEAVEELLAKRVDAAGQWDWHEYGPGEVERLTMQPWYMGVPVARQDGKQGVAVLREGLFVLRCGAGGSC